MKGFITLPVKFIQKDENNEDAFVQGSKMIRSTLIAGYSSELVDEDGHIYLSVSLLDGTSYNVYMLQPAFERLLIKAEKEIDAIYEKVHLN